MAPRTAFAQLALTLQRRRWSPRPMIRGDAAQKLLDNWPRWHVPPLFAGISANGGSERALRQQFSANGMTINHIYAPATDPPCSICCSLLSA